MPAPVLYRKWRPQTLSQVVGQEHVTRTLLNALATSRVSHAYLFCGPRGTGKTSTARILAKAVNCTTNGKGEPCASCEMCQAITEGSALDLVEIDAASNRGIDDIRDLREKINFAPAQARYKVYVVDEVHMLTDHAFNALLKTLEEPPPYAIFVLATTEVHRVPVTILSRCQRFDFRRISQRALQDYLARICDTEGIAFEQDGLELIARCAHGSARDAVNLLEQVEVAYGQRVDLTGVEELLGLASDPRAMVLVRAIAAGGLKEGMTAIQEVREDGGNLPQFGREVASYLRALLLLKAGAGDAVELPDELIVALKAIAPTITMGTVVVAVRCFTHLDFHGDQGSPLPLELALLDALAPTPSPAKVAAAAPAAPPPRPKAESTPRPMAAAGPAATKIMPTTVGQHPPAADAPAEPAAPVAFTPGDVDRLRQMLKEGRVPQMRFIESLLRNGCSVERIEGNHVVLGFRGAFSSHKERIEKPENLRLAEMAIQELTGAGYRIRCVLVENGAPAPAGDARGHLVRAALEAGAKQVT